MSNVKIQMSNQCQSPKSKLAAFSRGPTGTLEACGADWNHHAGVEKSMVKV